MNESCPACKSALLGQEIPPEFRATHGGQTHFSRLIGVEVKGLYDGILYWHCPDCGHEWPRFTEGRLHRVAVDLLAEKIGNS